MALTLLEVLDIIRSLAIYWFVQSDGTDEEVRELDGPKDLSAAASLFSDREEVMNESHWDHY